MNNDKNFFQNLFKENFSVYMDFFNTITMHSNLIETSKKFELDKSTLAKWEISQELFKKIIAKYMIDTNILKTKNFQKKYSLTENNNTIEIISLALLIPEKDLTAFRTSSIKWKNNFIDYLLTLNKYLFVSQINVIRYNLKIPLLDLKSID